MSSYFIVGGAGFIGSHFTDSLLADSSTRAVTLYDNFSSGKEWHYAHHAKDSRLEVVRGEVRDLAKLTEAMGDHETVIHLASNPDIAKAATEPAIDFWEGTYLTAQVVEAARVSGVKHVLYASGSGVYGDLGETEAQEDHGPMIPTSTYGASKLSGEALLASYCAMFDLKASAFRFGNVVGARQTHGVGFDFVRRLRSDATQLRILGDGSQSKSYIHVSDVVNAVLTAKREQKAPFMPYNVATGDYITVKAIADLACEVVDAKDVRYDFTGGTRGWKGDVPIVRLNTDRIKSLGWSCKHKTREALDKSMRAMIADLNAGKN